MLCVEVKVCVVCVCMSSRAVQKACPLGKIGEMNYGPFFIQP